MVKTAFSVILLLIGLVCMSGTLTWVIRKGNNNKMTRIFVLCQCSVVAWLISQFLILFSESTHQLWISYLIGNVG
ncbi:MAG TPA: two-component sensor histidine kinase, partial [Ruminococcus flavefaciens]|nr:two-component sensor histidine kinase [Ruminococcus flavefaciens]